jgi:hypothetical protein
MLNMKRMVGLLLAIVFAIGAWMPSEASAQRRFEKSRVYRTQDREYRRNRRDERRRRNRFYRNTYGYRNYGQYRRTQVGNRRFRWSRRYYYRNGRRLTRLVRIYY